MTIGLLFPGQGAQHPGMFESWVRLPEAIGTPLRELIGTDPTTLSAEAMHPNQIAQPLLVGYELAALEALRDDLPASFIVLGYSVGEISACAAAGMLAPEAAVRLASERAALMDRVAPPQSGMLALRGLPLDVIKRLAAEAGAEIAIENGPDHAVLGGFDGALKAAEAAAVQAGAKTVRRLPVSIASHTSLLAQAAAPFADMLAGSLIGDPEAQFISGQSAEPLWTRDAIVASLARQLHSPLHFADALTVARECGATAFLEVGPGHGLTQIVTDLMPDMPVRPLEAFRTAAGAGIWLKRYA